MLSDSVSFCAARGRDQQPSSGARYNASWALHETNGVPVSGQDTVIIVQRGAPSGVGKWAIVGTSTVDK